METKADYPSQFEAITSIAVKLGIAGATRAQAPRTTIPDETAEQPRTQVSRRDVGPLGPPDGR
jgi:hypothetical protein